MNVLSDRCLLGPFKFHGLVKVNLKNCLNIKVEQSNERI